ncbi:uncharacterized protein LOC135162511 [Diachasmimorpha longicaudata]|uniref:uncharacterized protein LOC135162511 n=1 Tax=Diachasmimorpha longicaudata TaxID=58733 RepID=UPI0030B90294
MQKSWLWVLIFVLVVQKISAQNCVLKWENGTTIADDFSFSIVLPEIEDTEQPGKILLTLISDNIQEIVEITTTSNEKLRYMNATIDGTSIIVNLTEHFIDYEKYETKKVIYIAVVFKCADEGQRTLEIRQPITDTNNHDPEFENTPYVYKLPMPFPSGVKLELLQRISAVDLDLTLTKMNFFLDSQDAVSEAFSISRLALPDDSNPKRQFASLQTKGVLNLLTDTTFYIYANDSMEPVRTGRTAVIIQVDKDNSALSFAKPLYSANCSDLSPGEADGFTPKFVEGDISLGGGTNDTEWTIEDVSKKYADNFKINISQNLENIEITLVKPPASFFQESFVALILSARKVGGAAASTVIHLTLPGRQSHDIPDAVPKNEDDSEDLTPVVITLAVLLAIVSAALIATIVLLRRPGRGTKPAEKSNGAVQPRGEMREVERLDSDPISNGLQRRSVAFNDTVEEIKVARL